jgi:two-component system, cell cycle sensor histidine kinase and response regulator CckA
MNETEIIKVLLVEDDEDDFIITRGLLSGIPGKRYMLDWAKTFETGLETMLRNQHDVCLVDYRLGAHNGIELLRLAQDRGCQSPVILLTGSGQHQVDVEAMQAGASDYLVKDRLETNWIERSIRYAIQRKRAAALAAFEQARLAAFGHEVGLALTRRDTLGSILDRCARAMVQYLNADLAQISTFNQKSQAFEVRASAGRAGETAGSTDQSPVVQPDLRRLATGQPLLIRQLLEDGQVLDREWVKREGMTSYAAYPLVLEDKLVGLMAIYTAHPLSEQVGQEMGSVANGIALCIERKRSEEALGVSEVKYRSVVETIKEVIFQLDKLGNWTFLNPAWTAITGFEVTETIGTLFLNYIHEEDRQHNRQVFQQLIARTLDYSRYETRWLTREGKTRWMEVYTHVTLNSDGTVLGASGSLTDVTERKLAETQIEKLAAFPRVSPNPVLEFAADGTLAYANAAARDMAKSLGQEDLLAILPREAPVIACECLASGQKKLREDICLNGRTITWSFFPVTTSQVVHCYGTDVTDVLNLEAQFRHAQKMESIGQLAAGVAHDINNVLTVVLGYAGLLLKTTPPESNASRSLKQIIAAGERAVRFIRQLLMFSRKQVIQANPLDLNAVIHNLEGMLTRLLGEDIALETSYLQDLPRVEADTGMIEQVVMNFAVNSRDAMPQGGRLLITTSSVAIDADYVQQHTEARVGRFVCLSVSDTGCGMDRNTLQKIFEPFFSTKEVGRGTGLGLATVYGIVKQHQGWIEVESQPGHGTTFKVYLSALAQPGGAVTDFISRPDAVRGGKEAILVVEDEVGLRELVRQVLGEYQYDVAVAASGAEALRVWDEHEGKFDLLLTDMIMPGGMTGRDLAEALKKRKPGLKVTFTSGYSSELIGKQLGRGTMAFLAKPYLPLHLARAVRECLDTPVAAENEPATI